MNLLSLLPNDVRSRSSKMALDDISFETGIGYIGISENGYGTDEAKWYILMVQSIAGVYYVTPASSQFDQIWDNRASLTYE